MATVGPTGTGTGADDATVGTVAWTNPGNVTTDDGNYATANLTGAGEKESSIKLVKGGVISGPDKTTDATIGTIEAYYSYNWSIPADLALSDTDVAAANFGFVVSYKESSFGSPVSHYLKGTNFGFSLPAGATVTNVLLEVKIFDNVGTASVNFARMTITYTPPAVSFVQPRAMVFQQQTHYCHTLE